MVGQLANHLGENRLDFYTLFPFQMDNTLNIFKINHKYTRRKHECFFKKNHLEADDWVEMAFKTPNT